MPGLPIQLLLRRSRHCLPVGDIQQDRERLKNEGGSDMEFLTKNEGETQQLGRRMGEKLTPGVVVAYTGDLGAGKTAFTRGLAQGLGIADRVTSPTFNIVNEYEGGRLPLFHFDLYRLGGADELFDIGWEDYLARGGVCAVEWSENAQGALEGPYIKVDIRRGDSDSQRVIGIEGIEL